MPDRSLDRRSFVASVLGAGGVAAVWPAAAGLAQTKVDPTNCVGRPNVFKPGQDKRPIMPRGTVEQLWTDKAWLKKMDAGYKWMRTINQNDPRSLTQQGNIHKIMCAGGPREVHGSDRFLAWHRCFVYFQERIVAYGSTGGATLDPTFRLAVWDWEGAATTPTFPVAFKQGSLVDPLRQPTYAAGDGSITAALATNDIFTFYGYPVGGAGGSPVLENAAHGQIHVDTGVQTAPYHNMGALPTAALDPVFCAHHGNIDKVWAWWQQLHPNRTPNTIDPATTKPYDPAWVKNVWYFYDCDGKCWSITAADVIDYRNNLRYSLPNAPGATTIRQIPLTLLNATLKLTPQGLVAPPTPSAQGAVSMLLRDVQIPAPGSGRFDLVATVGGKPKRVGHFALFAHPMERMTASFLAHIESGGVSVLQLGAAFKVVPASGGAGLVPGVGTALKASSATLLVE
jgi:polyphenol oxidase